MSNPEFAAEEGLNKHLLGLYRHELWYLASSIVLRCQSVFEKTRPPESGYYLQVAPEIHAEIFGVLSQAAALKKLIATAPAKGKDESRRVYQLRRHRAKVLAELLHGIDLEEILKAKVRNTIEHFDEYLDEAIVELSHAGPKAPPAAAYNLVLSDWGVFSPPPFPIRVYIAADQTFHNLKWSISLARICAEAKQIVARLRASGLAPSEDEEPGGLLVMLGAG